MTSDDRDILWNLDGAREFSTQEELYHHLDVADQLKDITYRSSHLKQRGEETKTQLRSKKFERVNFSKTSITGISFRNCTFDHCLFISSHINDCEFHACKFSSTNTHKIAITDTYIDPLSFTQCLEYSKHQNIGVHLYQVLLRNSRKTEQIEFERDAHFYFLRWKRLQDAYQIASLWKGGISGSAITEFLLLCLRYVRRWGWEKFFGSGLRIRYFSSTVVLVILILSTINYYFRLEFGLTLDNDTITSYWDALYFTTISVTTLGYGDITPTTLTGKLAATVQSVVGFCLFATLASMLFRRISP